MKTIEEVIIDLKELFKIDSVTNVNSGVFINRFYIDKRKFSRQDVVLELKKYFERIGQIGIYAELEPVTFIYTVFEIKKI